MMKEQNFQAVVYGGERLPTPRDIVTPVFRHRKLVVYTFLILMVGVVVGAILISNNYQAEMKILVKHARVDEAVSPGRDSTFTNPGDVTEEEINSEVELLKSRDLLEKVVLACNLQDSRPGLLGSLFSKGTVAKADTKRNQAEKLSEAVAKLEKKLQVEPIRKTDLIQVTYASSDPQLSARVLKLLGELYLEKTVAVHRPPGAFEFFQTQSQQFDQELQNAETRLTAFDRDNGVADPQLEKQITLQKLAEFESNFKTTQVQIKEEEKRTQAVEEQLASTPQQTMFQVRTSDNPYLIEQLRTTLLNLQLKRTELLDKYAPDYRPVQEVQQQIEQTLDAIAKAEKSPTREETTDRNPSYDWLRSELTKSSAELATLHARENETRDVISQYQAQLSTIDANGATQENLTREVKEAEGNYLLYVQKREEARIGDALDRQKIVNVAIAEAATVPALPTHSPWLLTLFFGTLFSAIVSPGLAFAVDYFDPSLRTPDEIRNIVGIPVLAALPKSEE